MTQMAKINLCAVLAAITVPAFASSECGAGSQYELRYIGDHKFEVTASYDASIDQLDLIDVPNATGDGSSSDFVSNVIEIAAGAETPLDYVGDGTWRRVNEPDNNRVAVRYIVSAAHENYDWHNGKEEVAYRFDEAYYFVGSRIFLASYGDLRNCPATVSFNLPADWAVAAPWPQVSEFNFETSDIDQLAFNGFAVGPNMNQFRAPFGDDGEVTIVYEDALTDTAREASNDLKKVVGRFTDIFDGVAKGDFYIFLTSDSGNDGGAFRNSFAQRFKLPVRPSDGIVWRSGFAHETLHLWIGHTIRPADGDIEWFKEGFTDYVTSKALYAEGIYDETDYLRKIENMIGRYILALVAGGPKPLVEAGHQKNANRMLVYGGGALVALVLDAEMAAEFGAGSFENMLAAIFAGSDEPYTQARLMSAMDAHSNGRATEILAAIDAGLDPFTLSDRLSPHGLNLAVFAPEEMYVSFDGKTCERRVSHCPPKFLTMR